MIGMYEFKPTEAFVRKLAGIVCHDEMPTQPICTNIITLLGGRNDKDLNIVIVVYLIRT